MIKYLIIDDEPMAHQILKGYADLLPSMQLMGQCYDAIEALAFLNTHEVDLLFLDLNMPKLKGFDFLKTLSAPPKVIVTTAYKEFALEGYALNVVDYLLKPISFERFLQAVNKVTNPVTVAHKITTSVKAPEEKRIFLRANKKYIQVVVNTILYLEAAGNYTKVITSIETVVVREKVSDLVIQLSTEDFIQVHKSFAVAKKHIHSIEGNRIHIQEHIIPIGKLYRDNIEQLL